MPATQAKELLKRYWDRKVPVDPFSIANAAGLKVSGSSTLDAVSGCYVEDGDNKEIIFNSNESFVRQRFTVAHELGHWALSHGSRFRDPPENYSIAAYDSKETAANRFAAELLMPSQAVEMAVREMKITDIRRLAEMFKVSQVAMKFRLQNLELL